MDRKRPTASEREELIYQQQHEIDVLTRHNFELRQKLQRYLIAEMQAKVDQYFSNGPEPAPPAPDRYTVGTFHLLAMGRNPAGRFEHGALIVPSQLDGDDLIGPWQSDYTQSANP